MLQHLSFEDEILLTSTRYAHLHIHNYSTWSPDLQIIGRIQDGADQRANESKQSLPPKVLQSALSELCTEEI